MASEDSAPLGSGCCGGIHAENVRLDEVRSGWGHEQVVLDFPTHSVAVQLTGGAARKVRDFLTAWLERDDDDIS